MSWTVQEMGSAPYSELGSAQLRLVFSCHQPRAVCLYLPGLQLQLLLLLLLLLSVR